MPVVAIDERSIAAALLRLRAGQAVVLPFPSPLPYAVVAAAPGPVNRLKGRPEEQPLGVLVANDDPEWISHIDLAPQTLDRVVRIGVETKLNLMLPLRAPSATDADGWTVAASHHGLLGITFSVRRDVRPLLDVFGHLYVSSANATGAKSAVSARQAAAEFDEGTLVLSGDNDRDLTRPHGSATILGVAKDGMLSVLRRGVHDLSFADSSAYVNHLVRRYGGVARTTD